MSYNKAPEAAQKNDDCIVFETRLYKSEVEEKCVRWFDLENDDQYQLSSDSWEKLKKALSNNLFDQELDDTLQCLFEYGEFENGQYVGRV